MRSTAPTFLFRPDTGRERPHLYLDLGADLRREPNVNKRDPEQLRLPLGFREPSQIANELAVVEESSVLLEKMKQQTTNSQVSRHA